MTRPRNDGRSMLERARELVKLRGIDAHERSGEIRRALGAAMRVVEAALRTREDFGRLHELGRALDDMDRPVRDE